MRRLIDLSTKAKRPHHFLSHNTQVRLDLQWWDDFLPTWNGRSFFLDSEWSRSNDMGLFTDSSTAGYGAFWNGRWLAGSWASHQHHHPIAWKELAAIVIASLAWGAHWRG